ncbi:MAG: ATP-dependent Clp protease ATP-binding subunit [Patescibacteria group bacterium]
MDTLDKFSNNYKKSLKTAAELAQELAHFWIDPIHLLYGLILQRGSVGAELFNSLELKPAEVKNSIAQSHLSKNQAVTKVLPQFSPDAKKIIQKSVQISYLNRHKYIGTEHLLTAILEVGDQEVKKIFNNFKLSENDLVQRAAAVLKSASKLPDLTEIFQVIGKRSEEYLDPEVPYGQTGVLDVFGVNLTSPKVQKKIDPVIGREEEISRVIQILSRRTKNNPIILGQPGVGKTAIVEGLAKKILSGDVPEILRDKKIYSLDLTATIAGTMYRGEFENRIKQIIEEVKNRPEVIIFIDEIHNIVGAGSASGSLDTANILKPALARGEIHCLGATTFEDYRKTIENDPALNRRFQPVKIDEPTGEQGRKILLGIKENLENFHHVRINETAISAAITLSQRYLPERFLPDKAIDLIDEACAAIRINKKTSALDKKIYKLTEEISSLNKNKETAIFSENFAEALAFKKQVELLNEELGALKKKNQKKSHLNIGEITDKDVAQILTKITGIPLDNLLSSEKRQLLNLDQQIKEMIIGQDGALKTIAGFVKRAKAGLTDETKPLASFIFVGPSGVGKTYTAKILAQSIFNSPEALIRIDMSEYSEKFNISKLIGAPAGYVGYKESGQLTEKVKHRPYSLILFDEIEKAHPEVFNLLLQVLDNGYLTDATGVKINFRNTVIIMTSNLGSHRFQRQKTIGFSQSQEKFSSPLEKIIINEVKNHFRTEFLNRVDKIIYFNPLSSHDLEDIVKLELKKLEEKLKKQKIALKFSRKLIVFLAKESQKDSPGARAISRTIQELIEMPLSQKILEDRASAGNTVQLSEKNGIIKLSVNA